MRKLEALRVGGIQIPQKMKKKKFCELEILFFCYFFLTPFYLHFQDNF
jgi:hypothetical protein